MPKNNISYQNTIIYKIYCKDKTISDIYVGHTTNFVVRKYQHKQACNNTNIQLKIYKTIRENGGWDNWDMVEIAKYNCKDSTEARIKEQEHYTELKASLNSCPPYVESPNLIYCKTCDYSTSRKSQFDRHILTDKHKILQNPTQSYIEKTWNCKCGKIYKHSSTFYAHRKNCNYQENVTSKNNDSDDDFELTDKEIIKELLKQTSKLIKVVENGTHNTTNSHNNNKTFNLSVFLNETCKDAMNISDFVSSIKLNLEDLEHTGRQGYLQGITNIVLKNLNNVEHHMRPLHCSDLKREVLYIKENNEWTKESEEKPILTKAIKTIANENIKQIKTWRDKYPDCSDVDSKKNNLYLKIVSNSMNGLTKEEGDKNINKIISNVVKEVTIDKEIT